MLSRKIKKAYKNGVTIEEFRDTLDKAIKLSNKLIEIITDDYLKGANLGNELGADEDVYVSADIHGEYGSLINDIYGEFNYDYYNINKNKQILEDIVSNLYNAICSYNRDYSRVDYYIEQHDKETYNNLENNISLFKTITSMIYNIQSIFLDKNYNLISNLEITKPSNFYLSFSYNFENKKYELEKDVITFEDEAKWLNSTDLNEHKIIPIMGELGPEVFGKSKIKWLPAYLNLKDTVNKYVPIILAGDEYNANNQIEIPNKLPLANNDFFQESGNIKKIFYNKDIIKLYDLSNINFNNKNISGIDISKNPEVKINFDKIIKDLTDSNINGYNLNKYTFRNYNLTNTDLRNTGATIDILSCNINIESKMSPGTLFDENNKFIIGDKQIPGSEIEKYGIKIKK